MSYQQYGVVKERDIRTGGCFHESKGNLGGNVSILPGQSAPDFYLQDQYGIDHQLSHYRGMWVVLCFLPYDYNSGCIKEACAIRDDFAGIQDRQAELFAINLDSRKIHRRFSDRYNLTFPLLTDDSGEVCERFDALWSLGPLKVVKRHSVIINPTGHMVRIYRRVEPKYHSKQIIEDLDRLQQTFKPEHKVLV